MDITTLATSSLIIFWNYVAGLICVYACYWLAFKNPNKKLHFLLGTSIFAFFVLVESFFFGFTLYVLPDLFSEHEGFGNEILFTIFFLLMAVFHTICLSCLVPWHYYQKHLPIIIDRKTLIRNTKTALFTTMLIPYCLFGMAYFFK